MKLEKICEALSQTDSLGVSLSSGCAVAQLFYAAGKSAQSITAATRYYGANGWNAYTELFDGLLVTVYGMTEDQAVDMVRLNDARSPVARRVLAHYEGLLAEQLIEESARAVVS